MSCTQPLTIEDVLLKPTNFAATGATAFTATVGTTVSSPGQVAVTDQYGDPMAGLNVQFSASGGTLTPTSTIQTNAQGIAAPASWTLPTTSGPATLSATLPNSGLGNVVFNVTLNAGPAVSAVANAGNAQTAAAGTNVATAPSVKVADEYGNGVPGVTVTFTVTAGGGTLNGATSTTTNVTTNASGVAALTSWRLGETVGSNALTATATGVSAPVAFTSTGVPGPVAQIALPAGAPTSQTVRAGTSVPVAPSVIVQDQFDNLAEGATVRFAVTAGSGKLFADAADATGSTTLDVVADADGVAGVFGWELGAVGSNTVSVTVPAVTSLPAFAITAVGEAGPPGLIEVHVETPSSDGQTAEVGTAVTVPPAVVVRDSNDFIAPNVEVTFTVGASSGTIQATSGGPAVTTAAILTDANGVARLHSWTLGNRGANTLDAHVTSDPSLTLTMNATGIAGPPANIAVFTEVPSSDNQTTVANTPVPVAPAVFVTDASGLAVEAGHEIEFTVGTGGGTVSATAGGTGTSTVTIETDADGVARLGYWKPGTVGANTLRAEVADNPTVFVNFNATGTLGTVQEIVFTNDPWPYTRASTANGGVPEVTVKDEGGNPLPSISVVWSSGNANSTVSGTTTSTTTSQGVATFPGTWTAAAVASGANMELRATASGTTIFGAATSTVVGAPTTHVMSQLAPATTTVNTVVSPSPEGVVQDAAGRPVPNALLSWSYLSNPGGNGTLNFNGVAPSQTDSIGRVILNTWRVSQVAGTNTVQFNVSGTAITRQLTTTGTAGPATNLVINAGNGQTAPSGQPVAIDPAVLVRDQFNNAVSGASITFQPSSGSGTVTGSPATSNASGIATVGSWTLGAAGPNSLSAFVTGTPGVSTTFTATSTDPCAPLSYTPGTTVNQALTTTDCQFTSGSVVRYTDKYRVTVGSGSTLSMLMNLNASGFGPQLRHYLYPPSEANWFNTSPTPTNLSNYLLLGPGTYDFGATSDAATTTGSYTFSSTINPGMPSDCEYILTTKGVNAVQGLSSTTCLYTHNGANVQRGSRVYGLYIPANTTTYVEVSGTSIDWVIDLYDVSGGTRTFLKKQDLAGAGGFESMEITPSSNSRFVEIRVTQYFTQPAASGTFTLDIDQ